MDKAKPPATPLDVNEKLVKEDGSEKTNASVSRSIVGSLIYLSSTRLDIMFSASLLSRFTQTPSKIHLGVAKRVLRYINGSTDFELWFSKLESENLHGFSDSDWVGSLDDSKSTSGYRFSFGSGVFFLELKETRGGGSIFRRSLVYI